MRLFSSKTTLEVLADIWLNLTSAWFGVVLVLPGILGVSSSLEYIRLLAVNSVFGIGSQTSYSWFIAHIVAFRKKQIAMNIQNFLNNINISYAVLMIAVILFAGLILITSKK